MIKFEKFIAAMNANCKMMDSIVVIGGVTYISDNLVSVNPSFEGSLLSSIMKCCEIELQYDEEINSDVATELKGKKVSSVKIGAKQEDTEDFDYIEYGSYIVYNSEYREESNSVVLTCYDSMLDSMIPWNIEVATDYTVKSLLLFICKTFGWKLADVPFANENVNIEAKAINSYLPTIISDEDTYKKVSSLGKGLTYRDMLDDIAEIIGGNLVFKNDGLLYPLYPNEAIMNSETVKLSVDNQQTISFEKEYGPINSVAIIDENSNAVFLEDEKSIETNGKCKVTITDNFLMGSNSKEFIDGIFNQIKGLSYVPFQFSSFGFGYMEFGDIFLLEDKKGNLNKTIMLNDSFLVSTTVNETASAKAYSADSETEYATSSAVDRIISKRFDNAMEAINTANSKIDTAIAEVRESYTEMIQNSQSILFSAIEECTRTEDFEKLKETVTSNFIMTSDSMNMNFTHLKEQIDTATDDTNKQLSKIYSYINFNEEGISLGKADSITEVAVKNDAVDINVNGETRTTIAADGITADNATFKKKLGIGTRFGFIERSSGNLSLKRFK
ncbi:MAG: hypothetical protein K2L37_00840 [Lactobacillus sp.]|nr:hypothetical protein [Lactobacillus sp.]